MYDGPCSYEHGIKIHAVQKQDLAIVCNYRKPLESKSKNQEEECDAIQISLSQLTVMWNLNKNNEIYTLMRPREFCTVQTFVNTGFIYDMNYMC